MSFLKDIGISIGSYSKAIKFIFGNHSDSRAQVELKSLDKIKEVRHPFLLGLDRIEVVDGAVVPAGQVPSEDLDVRAGDERVALAGDEDDPGDVSHFQALTTAVSGTVGV